THAAGAKRSLQRRPRFFCPLTRKRAGGSPCGDNSICRAHPEARSLLIFAGSGAGDEEFFVGLGVDFCGGDVGSYVLDEFAAALGALTLHCPDTAGGHGAGFEGGDTAVADLDLRTEPVGAIHASGGVEG